MLEIKIETKSLDEQDNTAPEPAPLTQEDLQLLDFCKELGSTCWDAFSTTSRAAVTLLLLPSDTVRNEAKRLFQLGFSARMLACPPRGPEALDNVLGPIQCDKTWREFLKTATGKVVLDAEAYPATGQSILHVARFFFTQGFIAGTVAYRECMKED